MSTEQIGRHRALPRAETPRRFMIERIPGRMIAIGAIATSAFIPVTTGHDKDSTKYTAASLTVESGASQLVEPDMTITVPDLLKKAPAQDYNLLAPMYENDPERCDVVKIPLESGISSQDLEAAAKIEMALPFDRYEALKDEVGYNLLEISPQAVQRIMTKALTPLGIDPVFVDKYSSANHETKKPTGSVSEQAANYAAGMLGHLRALREMPKTMLDNVERVQFVDGAIVDIENGDGIAGLAFTDNVPGRNDTIILTVASGSGDTFVHEVAHTLHAEACRGLNDFEMKMAYTQALGLLNTLGDRDTLERKLTHDLSDEELLETTKQLDRQRDLAGFPSNYALESKEFVELFAELSADLLDYQEHSVLAGESREAKALRQLTIERLQKAMPGVDVAAFVAARTYYRNGPLLGVPIEKVVKDKVSRYDMSYADYWRGIETGEYTAKPALALRSADGREVEYIYAYFQNQDTSKSADEDLRCEIGLSFPADTDTALKNDMLQKTTRYLEQYAAYDERVQGKERKLLGGDGTSYVIMRVVKGDKSAAN